MTFNKKPFRDFKKRPKAQTTEDKIRNFVIRNSQNGYFTNVSTLPQKFEISEVRVWEIVGELLDEGRIESIHDENSGKMKLCEIGKIYQILELDIQRKKESFQKFKKNTIKKSK